MLEIKNLVPRALDNFTDDGRFIIRHALRHTTPLERFSYPWIEEINPLHTAKLDDEEEDGEKIIEETGSDTSTVVEPSNKLHQVQQAFDILNSFLTPTFDQESTVEAEWLIHSITQAFDTNDSYLVVQPNFVPTGIA